MFVSRTKRVVCPNEDSRKATLQFPLDARAHLTEPEALSGTAHKVTEHLRSLIMYEFMDESKMSKFN